ncbi:lithostathine-1-beta-like [Argopecten irradians]|uniref:lithostathine-1-beta-like n=1 Tax=Argopecten irradians TaxID=31199 RepID=UPI003719A17F
MEVFCKVAIFILAVFLLLGGTESSLSSCPSTLTRNQYLHEFRGFCLEFIHAERTWDAARTDCNSRGGDLVEIGDQGTQDFVLTTLRALNWDRHGVWIGATDHDTERKWMWVSGREVTWSYWQPGEGPQHTGGFLFAPSSDSEDCAQIRLDDALGRWHDYRCSGIGIHYSYICQYFKATTETVTGQIFTGSFPSAAPTGGNGHQFTGSFPSAAPTGGNGHQFTGSQNPSAAPTGGDGHEFTGSHNPSAAPTDGVDSTVQFSTEYYVDAHTSISQYDEMSDD